MHRARGLSPQHVELCRNFVRAEGTFGVHKHGDSKFCNYHPSLDTFWCHCCEFARPGRAPSAAVCSPFGCYCYGELSVPCTNVTLHPGAVEPQSPTSQHSSHLCSPLNVMQDSSQPWRPTAVAKQTSDSLHLDRPCCGRLDVELTPNLTCQDEMSPCHSPYMLFRSLVNYHIFSGQKLGNLFDQSAWFDTSSLF